MNFTPFASSAACSLTTSATNMLRARAAAPSRAPVENAYRAMLSPNALRKSPPSDRYELSTSEFGKVLERDDWRVALQRSAVDTIERCWPKDTERKRLGALLQRFAETRNVVSHRIRDTGEYEVGFLVPEAVSTSGSAATVYELLQLLSEGYERRRLRK